MTQYMLSVCMVEGSDVPAPEVIETMYKRGGGPGGVAIAVQRWPEAGLPPSPAG